MPGYCAPNRTSSHAKEFYMSIYPADELMRGIWALNIRWVKEVVKWNGQVKELPEGQLYDETYFETHIIAYAIRHAA